jgi:mono/diheme cytochrome c family protein
MKQRRRAMHKMFAVLLAASAMHTAAATPSDAAAVERGKYLVKITGCNDCHTAGYPQAGGQIPVEQWLTGSDVGWRGAWGTTYPTNLRFTFQTLSEDQWVALAHTAQMRPPMPWFALRDLSERDLRDMYRFIRSLGMAGKPAPAYLPPGAVPQGPYVQYPMPPQ